MTKLFTCLLLVITCIPGMQAQSPLPSITEKNGRHILMVDGKPFFLFGGQAHNSSAWPALLPDVWRATADLNANTLEIPIYWEQIEPDKDHFDFSLVDTLLIQARQHHIRLVLLWFATWKNGSNHYMPGWMKHRPDTYPNCIGSNGQWIDSPTPIADATLEADKKAFTAIMRHLRSKDPEHTVILVQVENEPGAWNTVRDYSPAAQKLFAGPVPQTLLKPEILQQLGHPDAKSGSWQQVFGSDADEYFHAWYIARFIGQIAAAGKAEYPLPLYVNAALRDPLTHPAASTYESGGATDNVIPIWKAAAPAIDLVAPDIYLSGDAQISKVVELYTRPDNPLLVPEAGLTTDKVKILYEVLAQGGIGFSPFGIDDNGRPQKNHGADDKDSPAKTPDNASHLIPFAQEYAILSPLSTQLAQWSFEDRIRSAVEPDDHTPKTIDLGSWQAVITFGTGRGDHMRPNLQPTGKALIIRLGEDSFLVTGTLCRVSFRPTGKDQGKPWQYDKVEEGRYENGAFRPTRILNGDETDWGGPAFGAIPVMLRISVLTR